MPKWNTTLRVDFDKGQSISAPFAFDFADDPPLWRSEGAVNDNVLKEVVSSVKRSGKLVVLLPAGARAAFTEGKSCKFIGLEVKDDYGFTTGESWGGGTVTKSKPWVLHLPVATKHFGKGKMPMFGDRKTSMDPNKPKTVPKAQIGFVHVDSRLWLVSIAL